jgi:hypothetical protein
MSLAAILAAAQAASDAVQIAKAFAPMVGPLYDTVAAAMPAGSTGAQKLAAFKDGFIKAVEAEQSVEATVQAAWPIVNAMVNNYHAIRQAQDAKPTAPAA